MIWQDIAVERPLDDQEITEGLAGAFGIGLDQIAVSRAEDGFPDPRGATVLCLASTRPDGFRLLLSIYVYFSDSPPAAIGVLKKFAGSRQTKILVSDDSVNPYTMIQITPNGEMVGVNLDVERLDEDGEYHVVSTRD